MRCICIKRENFSKLVMQTSGRRFQLGNADGKNKSFLLIENMCCFFDVSNMASCQLNCL